MNVPVSTYNGMNKIVKLGSYAFVVLASGFIVGIVLYLNSAQAKDIEKVDSKVEKVKDKVAENHFKQMEEMALMKSDIKLILAMLKKEP